MTEKTKSPDVLNLKTNDGYEFKVNKPTTDEKGWATIEQQSFTIDKKEFIFKLFKEDFSWITLENSDQMIKLVNRSASLQKWYSNASGKYAQAINLPVAYKDVLGPEKYENLGTELSQYNKVQANKSLKIQEASERFRYEVSKIEDEAEALLKDLKGNNVLRILTMNQTELPITLQLQIESYTPKTDDVTNKKTTYAKEILFEYKKSLLKFFLRKENQDKNANYIISQLALK